MCEFFLGADLWANIIGGVVAAALVSLVAYLWDRRKHRILKDLIEIMGQAIKHRNIGEAKAFSDKDDWIRQAKIIEENAVTKARQLSTTAGSFIEWLDRIESWKVGDDVERYVAILSKVIERIRGLMERHS
jgi:hypothetical protein